MRSFYGSGKPLSMLGLDWLVESWVHQDGLESDDPDSEGGVMVTSRVVVPGTMTVNKPASSCEHATDAKG